MIKVIVFDLDDTLIPEIEYVKSGFKAIAEAYNDYNIYNRLLSLFMENKKDVYQRAGFTQDECKNCIKIYRQHKPTITLSNEVNETLLLLKQRGYKLGIITDGRPEGQWNKIYALELDNVIDEVIVTDELGGIEFRKPNCKAFELMRKKFDVKYSEMIYIGDNLSKDFIAPIKLGMKCLYYKNESGLYFDKKEVIDSIKICENIKAIVDIIEE